MVYNLRPRKNLRLKPSPPDDSDDSSDSEYMIFDTDDEEGVIIPQKGEKKLENKKIKAKDSKKKQESKKKSDSTEKKTKQKSKSKSKPNKRRKDNSSDEDESEIDEVLVKGIKGKGLKESPFDKVLKKLMKEYLPEGDGGDKKGKQNQKDQFITMQFVVGDEEDDEDDSDYDPDEDEDGGFIIGGGGFGNIFGQKKNPYDIRLPASKMSPELLEYLQKMPKLLGSSSKTGDDVKSFRALKKDDQRQIVESLKDMVSPSDKDEHPYFQILRLPLDPESKRSALEKQQQVIESESSPMGEVNTKLQNWIRGFLKIPFGEYVKISKKARKNPAKYLKNASDILDKEVYGLDDAKDHILRYVAQTITNPSAAGNCLAMLGPPGTGKTSLIKDALGTILNRPVHMIALAGNTDSSYLEGHSYTYEGSLWGQIADILMRSKCMNPVIIFDELDKVSKTQKGDEIIGILTHITDSTQNKNFQDKYFAGVNIDLSRVLFVFTLNDKSAVNSVLLDRLRIINTKGYSKKEKRTIGEDYLLPKILKEYNIKNLKITNDAWDYILNERDEPGVRNLKRDLETIVSRLNIYRLTKGSSETEVIKGIPSGIKWEENNGELITEDTSILLGNREDIKDKPPLGMYC